MHVVRLLELWVRRMRENLVVLEEGSLLRRAGREPVRREACVRHKNIRHMLGGGEEVVVRQGGGAMGVVRVEAYLRSCDCVRRV